MESEHDFLKYWRIVRYWAKAKYEIGTALVVELQKSIATLLSSRRKKRKTVANSETRVEQSAIGDNEQERREPNTIGLP